MKIGVALSGGSALGNVHIGIMKAFAENGVPIGCIAGTSAGAMVAACHAFEVPMDEVARVVRELNWFKVARLSYSALGIASNRAAVDIMDSLIGKGARIEDAKVPLAIVATDIVTGEKFVFRSGSVVQAVMASTCIPGLFAPIAHEGRLLVDGALVENLPIVELSAMGADATIGVNLNRWRSYPKPRHAVDVVVNTVDIMVHYQGIAHGERADLVIEPRLEAYNSSDWGKADALIEEGYRAATDSMPDVERVCRMRKRSPARAPWYVRWWRSLTG